MAAPITHIVLSDKVFDKYFEDKNEKDFYLGISFPDIRYLKIIERDKSHFQNLSLQEIKTEKSSFLAGFKFHSFTDQAREKFVISNDIYSLYPKFKYLTESLKLLEDDILYGKLNNWEKIISYFNEITEEELSFGAEENDIMKWHKILQRYFSKQPDENVRKNLLISDFDFSEDVANEINSNIKRIKNNQKVIQLVYEMYDNFLNEQPFYLQCPKR